MEVKICGMEKTSVVIEGGGMRGMYAAGVLDCLIQHNLYWNNVYGVSAGACHGLSYVSRQFDRARRVNVNYVKKARYSGLFCLLRYGTYFGFDYIFRKIPLENPIDWHTFFYNQNKDRRFFITVTNAETGKAEYVQPANPQETLLWIEASSSLPVIGKAVHIKGTDWYDGGIADSIPVNQAQEDGHTKHIIILTQPEGYRKKPVSKTTEKALRCMYKKYPAMVQANLERAEKYNQTLEFVSQLEQTGKAFVFRPSQQVVVDRLSKNKKKLQRLYEAGYNDCVARLDSIVRFAHPTTQPVPPMEEE